jgi:hypothetical protein
MMNQINQYFQRIKICQMLKAAQNTEILKIFRKCYFWDMLVILKDKFKIIINSVNFKKCENE